MTEQIAVVENAGLKNAGFENDGPKMPGYGTDTSAPRHFGTGAEVSLSGLTKT